MAEQQRRQQEPKKDDDKDKDKDKDKDSTNQRRSVGRGQRGRAIVRSSLALRGSTKLKTRIRFRTVSTLARREASRPREFARHATAPVNSASLRADGKPAATITFTPRPRCVALREGGRSPAAAVSRSLLVVARGGEAVEDAHVLERRRVAA